MQRHHVTGFVQFFHQTWCEWIDLQLPSFDYASKGLHGVLEFSVAAAVRSLSSPAFAKDDSESHRHKANDAGTFRPPRCIPR